MRPNRWLNQYEVWEGDPQNNNWRICHTCNDADEALDYYEFLIQSNWFAAIVDRQVIMEDDRI